MLKFQEELWHADVTTVLSEFFTPNFADNENDLSSRLKSTTRNLIFPCLKNRFLPSKNIGQYFQKVTDTQNAFRKFGRC
jgi:hypothetical protein